jgi:hypothetical protein
MGKREFTDLDDIRLLNRGNLILKDLFSGGSSSIRAISKSDSVARGSYRFLNNTAVSEEDIIENLVENCKSSSKGKYVVCIQDSSSVNLTSHKNRIKNKNVVGAINSHKETAFGFKLHPSLVLDAEHCIPYGYSSIKLWHRSDNLPSKKVRRYQSLPIEEKESYKWIEVSEATKNNLVDSVEGMVIVQDREGDIYEQYATVPNNKTDLLIRAKSDRKLQNGIHLFSSVNKAEIGGTYEVVVDGKSGRKKRKAEIAIKYCPVRLVRPTTCSKKVAPYIDLYFIEAKEIGYAGKDAICWRLLTTIHVENFEIARLCVEWYSWRWTVEEVFKILKKEGFNIEASELEDGEAIRKLTLLILEVIIKLFLMRIAYNCPELDIDAGSCFNKEEQVFLEAQIKELEGKTAKQKNPYTEKKLARYTWCIARLGGWKGYEKQRKPGITTLWRGYSKFSNAMSGWKIARDVYTR